MNLHQGAAQTGCERMVLRTLAAAAVLSCMSSCSPVPPPSEDYFWDDVSDVVANAEARRVPEAATGAHARTIAFMPNSIPSLHRGLEPVMKRYFTKAGIAWVDLDSSAGVPRVVARGDRGAERGSGSARLSGEVCVLLLQIEGTGEKREVVWRYDCGSGPNELPHRVKFYWRGDGWTTTRTGPDRR